MFESLSDILTNMAALVTILVVIIPLFIKFYPRQFFDSLDNKLIILFKFSSFSKKFHQQVIYSHRIFNVRGLRTQGTFTLELNHVFVALQITHTNIQKANVNPILVKELEGKQEIWNFLQRDDLPVLAIIGAPGCGKTTLLQYLALTFAQNKQPKMSYFVPILLFLREHTDKIKQNVSLAELVSQHFEDEKRFPTLNPPKNWFKTKLENKPCLILLDGLDEVAQEEDRKQVSAWVNQQIKSYQHYRFIITSRPQGYKTAPIAQAKMVLEVLPFSQAQIQRFVHQWYLANEKVSFGKEDEGVRQKARLEAEDLLKRLQQTSNLNELTVNPLLLTMIAMVHRYRGQLPGRRVELYGEICDVLLGFWHQAKGLQDSLTAFQKRAILEPLAAYMMKKGIREISRNDAMQVIRSPLSRVGLKGKETQHFLEDLQASSGLFLENEINTWRFAHLTFQEYLAASYFKEKQTKLAWSYLVSRSWWQECLRLYAALDDATPLVQACLEENTVVALSLAADCLEEARQLDCEVRDELEQRLLAGLESEEPAIFKLAAEVKLKRRLRNLQRIDDTTEIDLTLISCAEYQLFLDEMREEDNYYQPDHWTSFRFAKGQANKPILGIRAEDAVRFCKWLQTKESHHYRLPTLQELEDNHIDTTFSFFYQQGENVERQVPQIQALPTNLQAYYRSHVELIIFYNQHSENVERQVPQIQTLLTKLQAHSQLDLTIKDIEKLLVEENLLILRENYAFVFFYALIYFYILIAAVDKQFIGDFTRDFARDFARYFNGYFDGYRDFDRDFSRDFSRYFSRYFDHYFDGYRNFDPYFDRHFSRYFDRYFAHDFAYYFDRYRDFDRGFNDLFLEKIDIVKTSPALNCEIEPFKTPLLTVLNWYKGEQSTEMHTSLLNFMLYFTENSYDALNTDKFSWWKRLLRLIQRDRKLIEHQQKLRLFYVHTLITLLRREGKLSWEGEGIRIVRERDGK